MKEYVKQKFRDMTDEQKEQWLADNKLAPDTMWRMAEGNPQSDVTSDGKPIEGNQIKLIGFKPKRGAARQ